MTPQEFINTFPMEVTVINIILGIIGLILSFIIPILGWTLKTLSKASQDNATQQIQLTSILKEVSKIAAIEKESAIINTKVKNLDSGIAASIISLNKCITELRADLRLHKNETDKFIKRELHDTKTVIMDKLELMMLRERNG
tara:strand:- start:826 stop:1251 length:426 start_codon:yes stop_codon:yes gene_type:complete